MLEDEEDAKCVEYIKGYLPQDLEGKGADEDLYYIHDGLVD